MGFSPCGGDRIGDLTGSNTSNTVITQRIRAPNFVRMISRNNTFQISYLAQRTGQTVVIARLK